MSKPKEKTRRSLRVESDSYCLVIALHMDVL
jgi:hypothetical protein